MPLEKFNLSAVLTRTREGVNLVEADVLISKGEAAAGALTFANLAAFTTYLADFESIGVNAKDSPKFGDEDLVEEMDYESETTGVKCSGEITVKRVNAGLISFLDTNLRNEVVTLMIVPKDRTGQGLVISGVKLTSKTDGKANSDTTSTVVLSYNKRVEERVNVYKYFTIPTE